MWVLWLEAKGCCENGANCGYCHLPHGERVWRPRIDPKLMAVLGHLGTSLDIWGHLGTGGHRCPDPLSEAPKLDKRQRLVLQSLPENILLDRD